MGFKDAPDPPDYAGAAQQQAQASAENTTRQTYANRPTQNTPWGSITYNTSAGVDPATGTPITNWEQNLTLTPDSQAALDSQMRIQAGRSGLAEGLLGRAGEEFGQPFDWNSLPEYGATPTVTDPFSFKGPNVSANGTLPALSSLPTASRVTPGNVQSSIDTSGLQEVDPSQRYYDQAGDAVYGQFSRRMEPQFAQDTAALDTKLQNMGFRPGDEGYDRELQKLRQSQEDARLNAMDQATLRSGEEAQRMYGMDLGLRGQQFGERQAEGTFANNASDLGFNQQLNAADLGFTQGMQIANTNFGQQQQLFENEQNAGDQRFRQEQQIYQNTAGADANRFAQQSEAARYATALRQQALVEQMQRRGMSLNEINAILYGQQVAQPSMPGFNGAERAETPQMLAATGMGYQGKLDNFNAQQAALQGLLEGIGSIVPF